MSIPAPHGTEHIRLSGPGVSLETWWDAYARHLKGMSPTSRDVLEADAEFIVTRGVFGDGEPGSGAWPESRERAGLVMGAVQSGKTASMMAVTAKAFDRGVDAVIILGGTRTALWKQTYDRASQQLAFTHEAHKRRLLVPRTITSEPADLSIDLLYRIGAPAALDLALRQKRPIFAIVMKNWAHLQRLATEMREVYGRARERDHPFHVLVIDDEADDSSVVDVSSESVASEPKQVPRRIVDVWEDRSTPGQTVNANVYATYLAYTATPQANFLQDETNPLAPRNFVVSLRTPGAEGLPTVRTPSYRVPEGVTSWYTGGDMYYRLLQSEPLCVPVDDVPEDEQVPAAVRAFLVASAVRLLREQHRLDPVAAGARTYLSSDEAEKLSPAVASMLIHPSSGMDDHFLLARELLQWSAGETSVLPAGDVDTQMDRQLSSAGLARDMHDNPHLWVGWLESYRRSADEVSALPGGNSRSVPPPDEWAEISALILERIVPATSVRVINSHADADDRPQYAPTEQDDGSWRAARNLSTIFVSGNVMSRGLTLEGLTTTLFTRRGGVPLADTQMQMQRWFGYRGGYIDLCRVLMPEQVIENFISYHADDEALRHDVLGRMESSGQLPTMSVLQGHTYVATGKIANVRSQPLFPGPAPFVTHMNAPEEDEDNARVVGAIFADEPVVVGDPARPRGLLAAEPLSLLQAADLLDSLRYADHGPGPDSDTADRWRSLENHAQLRADPGVPLYRSPLVPEGRELGARSPYWIAAYLRFWHACLVRRVPSIITTDQPPMRWDLTDLDQKARQQPRFWLGLRFGDGSVVTEGALTSFPVPVRSMKRAVGHGGNELTATWGSRGRDSDGRITGDAQFDYEARGSTPRLTSDSSRRPGEDGLVLFHPVERASGRVTIAVGLSIPLGGPDQIRAVTGGPHDRDA